MALRYARFHSCDLLVNRYRFLKGTRSEKKNGREFSRYKRYRGEKRERIFVFLKKFLPVEIFSCIIVF